MKRNVIIPRKDWEKSVEADGLIWHTASGVPYWDESAYYSFTMKQVDEIEKATISLQEIFLEAGQYLINNSNLLSEKFSISTKFHNLIIDSWNNDYPALNYGRFDFGYDGVNPPKLFEYNCDTPTSLLEAAVIQWNWKEECFPKMDQFNSIHESLVAKWRNIAPHLNSGYVHFACINDESGEDIVNTAYMMDVASEAGVEVIPIDMDHIGYNIYANEFRDNQEVQMEVICKLYPWEWLMNEPIADHIIRTSKKTQWLEPIWKSIWSNKAILPILYELAPKHPNLLACYDTMPPLSDDATGYNFVRKPTLSREGANVTIVKDGEIIAESMGKYLTGDCVYQEMFAIPDFGGGKYPVIGSWVVDGEPVGMGIREDGLITGNTARFIPHIIEG